MERLLPIPQCQATTSKAEFGLHLAEFGDGKFEILSRVGGGEREGLALALALTRTLT